MSIQPDAGTVIGDSRRLRYSVEHRLANAIAPGGAGGRVSVTASGDEEAAVVCVSDNGPGIPEEAQVQVFDRFHRVSPASHGDAALGLGLPLTRQFIEAHGGTVDLKSAKGEGTTVTLRIPRAQP